MQGSWISFRRLDSFYLNPLVLNFETSLNKGLLLGVCVYVKMRNFILRPSILNFISLQSFRFSLCFIQHPAALNLNDSQLQYGKSAHRFLYRSWVPLADVLRSESIDVNFELISVSEIFILLKVIQVCSGWIHNAKAIMALAINFYPSAKCLEMISFIS
jgi:hypothetical protein